MPVLRTDQVHRDSLLALPTLRASYLRRGGESHTSVSHFALVGETAQTRVKVLPVHQVGKQPGTGAESTESAEAPRHMTPLNTEGEPDRKGKGSGVWSLHFYFKISKMVW